jgi:putative FmdB family regulatory protein
MPTYEFECGEHGTFELMRRMAEAKLPAACPTCGGAARRILSSPNVALMAASARIATAVNERSRHEPRLVQREAPKSEPARPKLHGSSCGRPWAIGH